MFFRKIEFYYKQISSFYLLKYLLLSIKTYSWCSYWFCCSCCYLCLIKYLNGDNIDTFYILLNFVKQSFGLEQQTLIFMSLWYHHNIWNVTRKNFLICCSCNLLFRSKNERWQVVPNSCLWWERQQHAHHRIECTRQHIWTEMERNQ